MNDDIYDLRDLIERLEKIRDDPEGYVIYTLTKEIEKIKQHFSEEP